MVQAAGADTERKIIAILKVLSESSEPLGSITIARELERHGISLSERAIRYHLRITDERGYTQPMGRDGRMLTPPGIDELKMALAPEQLHFINEKLELLAFQTTFDPVKRSGLLPINTSLIDRKLFPGALDAMSEAFNAGICVSQLVATAREGEKLGSVVVPAGKIGLATVCSAVINGFLLKCGVPVESRFGGVLEIRDRQPRRFVAVISYDGTSVDPSEQFIRARMTSVTEIARSGSGKMLANFRELPAPARASVVEKTALLKEAGINGVYVLGNTSEPICQLAVGLNRIGMALVGGLNPLAAVFEQGITVDNIAESGLIEYQQLVNFRELLKTHKEK
ncbi:MAG: NrpR regulatory domain-containing protein [Chloroflexota bacterium]